MSKLNLESRRIIETFRKTDETNVNFSHSLFSIIYRRSSPILHNTSAWNIQIAYKNNIYILMPYISLSFWILITRSLNKTEFLNWILLIFSARNSSFYIEYTFIVTIHYIKIIYHKRNLWWINIEKKHIYVWWIIITVHSNGLLPSNNNQFINWMKSAHFPQYENILQFTMEKVRN